MYYPDCMKDIEIKCAFWNPEKGDWDDVVLGHKGNGVRSSYDKSVIDKGDRNNDLQLTWCARVKKTTC